ncbi:MAG: hypothetical protein A2831_02615 [Candidatus Yanofskybacteria bacterium RIFCSPHIGHO2_01_FULL_44_17]|uniref:Uncharacterized protein n=1 Tax=Candidatus Yanofskybacteria bacterium RIFCSPHIGHO2_01_FULL_44_17 TaxID=1802668 RepID=A0A1F8EVP8_9BACT|nr:MAG: hypothetical protein A2831_02615 [Candidatus Yanofskybacteria bacterium RIFCSPHIGHO2_01_FULL_44_17]
MDSRCTDLLFCCLYLLKEETKNNITFYYDRHLLDWALYKMVKAEKMPEWFRKDFTYDILYGQSESMRHLFSEAGQSLLIDYVFNAAGSKIRLSFGERVYKGMFRDLALPEEEVKQMSEILEAFLAQGKTIYQKVSI